jgi:hypothetical protein
MNKIKLSSNYKKSYFTKIILIALFVSQVWSDQVVALYYEPNGFKHVSEDLSLWANNLTKQTPVVGNGEYYYQFILVDTNKKPVPNKLYALSTTGEKGQYNLEFVKEEKDVFQGITDKNGKTAIFRTMTKIPLKNWFLRERVGSGIYGEQFQLTSTADDTSISDYPYTIVACYKKPYSYSGTTDSNGYTAYAASGEEINLLLFTDTGKGINIAKECKDKNKIIK